MTLDVRRVLADADALLTRKQRERIALARARRLVGKDFDPNQPRDEEGKWTDGGGGGGGTTPATAAEKPATEKPSGKFGQYTKLPVDKVQVGTVRAAIQDKLDENYAIDLVGSILEHKSFPLAGYEFDFERALKKSGIDPSKLSEYTDEQIYESLKKDPKILAGIDTLGQTEQSGHTKIDAIIEKSINSKEAQNRVADIIIEASKSEGAWNKVGTQISAVAMTMHGMRAFRGDVLDKLADSLPPARVREAPIQMYMKNYDDFLPEFVSQWTMVGGTPAYRRSYAAIGNQLMNRSVSKFWMGKAPLTLSEQIPSENLKKNLLELHARTQAFYEKKFATKREPKPDLSTKTMMVQRGVAGHPDDYTPAPVESWTVDKNTPKRFGELMSSPKDDNRYSILTAEVPVSSVLMSYESLKGVWPAEKDLKGKKEIVVLGGALRQISNEKFTA